jgi:hypothetical protein
VIARDEAHLAREVEVEEGDLPVATEPPGTASRYEWRPSMRANARYGSRVASRRRVTGMPES